MPSRPPSTRVPKRGLFSMRRYGLHAPPAQANVAAHDQGVVARSMSSRRLRGADPQRANVFTLYTAKRPLANVSYLQDITRAVNQSGADRLRLRVRRQSGAKFGSRLPCCSSPSPLSPGWNLFTVRSMPSHLFVPPEQPRLYASSIPLSHWCSSSSALSPAVTSCELTDMFNNLTSCQRHRAVRADGVVVASPERRRVEARKQLKNNDHFS